MTEYHIEALWDDEVKVWVATSDDVPGLATEADTMEALMAKLRVMIPELLELSGITPGASIPFRLHAERFDAARPV